jgi:hypothetical protein
LQDILPETIKRADTEKMISQLKVQPRNEFNKMVHSLERFSRKGAEQEVKAGTGNRVTRWEKKEVGYQVAQANREIAKERKQFSELEATSRGEKTGLKRGEMGSERLNNLKPIDYNFDRIRGGKEWDKFKEMVKRKSTPTARDEIMERYKANYLKGLDEYGGYADDIKAIIERLPADVVVKTYYQEQEATIKFYYEGIEGLQEKDTVIDIIRSVWTRALEEYEQSLFR